VERLFTVPLLAFFEQVSQHGLSAKNFGRRLLGDSSTATPKVMSTRAAATTVALIVAGIAQNTPRCAGMAA
jgi:hypothetical protein